MCARVIELGREGASKYEMALELDIAMSTFALWEQQHKEFSESVNRAVQLAQGWWEREGRKSTFRSEGFNATSYIFTMTNRFGADWKHKSEQTNVHEAGTSFAGLLGALTGSVFPKADDENS